MAVVAYSCVRCSRRRFLLYTLEWMRPLPRALTLFACKQTTCLLLLLLLPTQPREKVKAHAMLCSRASGASICQSETRQYVTRPTFFFCVRFTWALLLSDRYYHTSCWTQSTLIPRCVLSSSLSSRSALCGMGSSAFSAGLNRRESGVEFSNCTSVLFFYHTVV